MRTFRYIVDYGSFWLMVLALSPLAIVEYVWRMLNGEDLDMYWLSLAVSMRPLIDRARRKAWERSANWRGWMGW